MQHKSIAFISASAQCL